MELYFHTHFNLSFNFYGTLLPNKAHLKNWRQYLELYFQKHKKKNSSSWDYTPSKSLWNYTSTKTVYNFLGLYSQTHTITISFIFLLPFQKKYASAHKSTITTNHGTSAILLRNSSSFSCPKIFLLFLHIFTRFPLQILVAIVATPCEPANIEKNY